MQRLHLFLGLGVCMWTITAEIHSKVGKTLIFSLLNHENLQGTASDGNIRMKLFGGERSYRSYGIQSGTAQEVGKSSRCPVCKYETFHRQLTELLIALLRAHQSRRNKCRNNVTLQLMAKRAVIAFTSAVSIRLRVYEIYKHLPRYCLFLPGLHSCKVMLQNRWIWIEPSPSKSDAQLSPRQSTDSLRHRHSFLASIVRIGDGCTGTLLTSQYVLTAAHCIHDGRNYMRHLSQVKVGVPGNVGFRLHYISNVFIPKQWLDLNNRTDGMRAMYDFAVLHLQLPVGGSKDYLRLLVTTPSVNSRIFFIGFAGYPVYHSELWQSSCIIGPSSVLHSNLIFSNCHSKRGMSGAAAYVEDRVHGRRIIGVVSNMTPGRNNGQNNREKNYSVIMKFTWLKLVEICKFMGEIAVKGRLCPDSVIR